MLDYPYNLYSDMVGEKESVLSSAQIDAINNYVDSMPEIVRSAIRQNYRDGDSLEMIEECIHISGFSKVDAQHQIDIGLCTLKAFQHNIDNGIFINREKDLSGMPIVALLLSNRAMKCLNPTFKNYGELISYINGTLLRDPTRHWYDNIKFCGPQTAKEIQNKLISDDIVIQVDPSLYDF